MRWASYVSTIDGESHAALLNGGRLHGLEPGTDVLGLLQAGTLEKAARRAISNPFEVVAIESVTLLSPIESPPSVRDFMSFETHVVTSMRAIGGTISPVWYEQPVFYFSNPAAIVGPSADIRISPGSSEFDFELEIAAIVGTKGSNLSVPEAEARIAGYTIMCDWSARDLQERESKIGLGPAKGKDGATSLGPVIITPDELEPLRSGNGYDIAMTVDVNGRRYSAGNWNSIYWSFGQMLSYASRGTTLLPGDIIGSGTVGTGCILELGRVHGRDTFPYLAAGDEVSITADQFGEIRAAILPGTAPSPL